MGIKVPARSSHNLLNCARRIREMFGVENTLYFPIVEILELMAAKFKNFNISIETDSDMPLAYAYWSPKDKTLYVRESVYLGAQAGNGRDRFTLVHELSHYFLHDESDVQFARADEHYPVYCDSEWQANTCASFILMEPRSIRDMSIDDIVSECGVSRQAATIAKNKALR